MVLKKSYWATGQTLSQLVLNGFSRGAPRQRIHRWPQRHQNRDRGCLEVTHSTRGCLEVTYSTGSAHSTTNDVEELPFVEKNPMQLPLDSREGSIVSLSPESRIFELRSLLSVHIADTEAPELDSVLLLMCNLQALCVLAFLQESLAHARLVEPQWTQKIADIVKTSTWVSRHAGGSIGNGTFFWLAHRASQSRVYRESQLEECLLSLSLNKERADQRKKRQKKHKHTETHENTRRHTRREKDGSDYLQNASVCIFKNSKGREIEKGRKREREKKKPLCVDAKRFCVYVQDVSCGRFAGTHGDVLNVHTEAFCIFTQGSFRVPPHTTHIAQQHQHQHPHTTRQHSTPQHKTQNAHSTHTLSTHTHNHLNTRAQHTTRHKRHTHHTHQHHPHPPHKPTHTTPHATLTYHGQPTIILQVSFPIRRENLKIS